MNVNKLQAALAAATNEVTVAAANINFDFTLVKYEAPKEFQPLGDVLSTKRKDEAESGLSHVTARRLGALFEGICPTAPNLIKAYGTRVSEISKAASSAETSKSFANSIFAPLAGFDGTTIWAAATASKAALHVHLLACILARSWNPSEATAIWVELVKERQKDILARLDKGESIPFSLAAAAGQLDIPRTQLANWDASARAWLRTADSIKIREQTQLELILKNISLPVNRESKLYASVVKAWSCALSTMEKLVSGMPQAVKDAAVLVGLSAWHLYPDMIVLGARTTDLQMNDPLFVPGGVLTLGLHERGSTENRGIHWSLSLAHLMHYGRPVQKTARISDDPSRIPFADIHYCMLGAVLKSWNAQREQYPKAAQVILEMNRMLQKISRNPGTTGAIGLQAFKMLASAATDFLDTHHKRKERIRQLINLGVHRYDTFVFGVDQYNPNLSGTFLNENRLGIHPSTRLLRNIRSSENAIQFLRHVASKTVGLSGEEALIRYPFGTEFVAGSSQKSFATALPISIKTAKGKRTALDTEFTKCHCRWNHLVDVLPHKSGISNEYMEALPSFGNNITSDVDAIRAHLTAYGGRKKFILTYGNPTTVGLFLTGEGRATLTSSNDYDFKADEILWCLESGYIDPEDILEDVCDLESVLSRTLLSVAVACKVYATIPDATFAVEVFNRQLMNTFWVRYCWSGSPAPSDIGVYTLDHQMAFSAISYFDTGQSDLEPRQLFHAIALSSTDSLFIRNTLLCDPYEVPEPYEVKRLRGNVGKAGISVLMTPPSPMIRNVEPSSWRSVNLVGFNGKPEDAFRGTSLHLSFTGYQAPLYDGNSGLFDYQASFLESVVSVHDAGVWVADIDIANALNNVQRMELQPPCMHAKHLSPDRELISVECWDEVLEKPTGIVITRSHGNWVARLALASVISQLHLGTKPLTLCPKEVCWVCWSQIVRKFEDEALIY